MSKLVKNIIQIFIFDPYQIEKTNENKYYISYPVIKFLCESVEDLYSSINKVKSELIIFYGKPNNVVKYVIKFLKKYLVDKKFCLGFNEDFTLYSLRRDKEIITTCMEFNIPTILNDDDYTLCSMEKLKKNKEEAYKQYGAFRKNLLKQEINKPDFIKINFIKKKINFQKVFKIKDIKTFWINKLPEYYKAKEEGKRDLALKKLSILQDFKAYNEERNNLSYETTHLSAYLNFGLISEREFYVKLKEKLGNSTQLINQIYWRDFFLCILRYIKNANSYDLHIDNRYNKLKWISKLPFKKKINYKEWHLMINSETGFLIVDAAIQEIKHTGYMHNRCRMIVGIFCVKYLKINPLCRFIGLNDWFSRYLLDCSTSQNKLNGQWVSELDFPGKKYAPSNAPLAGRPMSISNDIIKKWDNDCKYIKKWLPHLANVNNKILFKWDTNFDINIHPGPIFDSKERYKEWIDLCKI